MNAFNNLDENNNKDSNIEEIEVTLHDEFRLRLEMDFFTRLCVQPFLKDPYLGINLMN